MVDVVVMKQVLRHCCIDDGKCDEEVAPRKGPHRINGCSAEEDLADIISPFFAYHRLLD